MGFRGFMQDIADSKTELADAKRKLADAEADGNKMEIQRCREDLRDVRALLIERTALWKNILASQGKLTILSLFIACLYPLHSTL